MFDTLKYIKKKMIRTSEPKQELGMNGEVLDEAKVKDPIIKFRKPMYVKQKQGYRPPGVIFYTPEHDLPTIANAIALDATLNRSVAIYVEQIMKNGFEVVSKTDKLQSHALKRIREIEIGTNMKFNELIGVVSNQLVQYGTAYIIKVRKQTPNAKSYKLFNRTVKPIVGLFVADATTIEIGINNMNKISHYRQWVHGEHVTWSVDDVIQLTYNKVPGQLTGRSNINQVLDDVRALRKLEEEVEILGFQYSIPLYLYKVGTDTHPAAPGEIEQVSAAIAHMPTYGMMCVPHTHDMEAVQQNNASIDLIPFIKHFHHRILAGLGISPVAMGESDTSNRNTSEVQDLSMQSTTKSYQQVIKNKIDMELLKEITLDGGYDPMKVLLELRFPEIDLESQIKKETHVLQKYQGNLISLTEARLEINMETKVDTNDFYLNNVQIPLIEAESKAEMDVQAPALQTQEKIAKIGAANRATSVSTSTGGRSKSKGTKANKTASASTKSTIAKSRPTNQYGTQLSRPKIKRDFLDSIMSYSDGLGEVLLTDDSFKSDLNRQTFIKKVSNNIKVNINKYLLYTIKEYEDYYHTKSDIDTQAVTNEISNHISLRIADKVNRLKHVNDSNTDIKVAYTLKSLKDDIDCEEKIENYVHCHILGSMGYKSILYNSDECDQHSSYNIDIQDVTLDSVPPFKNGCECRIEDTICQQN